MLPPKAVQQKGHQHVRPSEKSGTDEADVWNIISLRRFANVAHRRQAAAGNGGRPPPATVVAHRRRTAAVSWPWPCTTGLEESPTGLKGSPVQQTVALAWAQTVSYWYQLGIGPNSCVG